MTGLFRPWTEISVTDKKIIYDDGMTRLPEDRLLQQDSTVSTTTSVNSNVAEPEPVPAKPEDVRSREIKYKSVKEHMRKRSEKYLQKKLKGKKCEPAGDNSFNDRPQYFPGNFPVPISSANGDVRDLLPANPIVLPNLCCPTDGLYNRFENIFSAEGIASGDFGLKNSPELLETALSQGLAPSFVEEYARLLTEQQRQISEKNRKQRPKKFRCPHCQVGFSNNGQLKGHIRIHTGERPFKCDAESCGKSFTRNEELTRHRRIHSGLRPFPCPECGKRFGRKDHLKKHVKTHFQQRYQLVPILPSHYPYIYGF